MGNIEVELRSFISREKYYELIKFFDETAKFLGEENQITYYYDSEQDLRIQQSDLSAQTGNYSKIWLKKGKIHDDSREEIEVKCQRDDFGLLHQLFTSLGYAKEIEWRRKRRSYLWDNITVTIDYTRGYGYILEMEILTSENGKQEAVGLINKKFQDLSIKITPKEEFELKYEEYKNNWRKLII